MRGVFCVASALFIGMIFAGPAGCDVIPGFERPGAASDDFDGTWDGSTPADPRAFTAPGDPSHPEDPAADPQSDTTAGITGALAPAAALAEARTLMLGDLRAACGVDATTVYFERGGADLDPGALAVLEPIAECLTALPVERLVDVVGFADPAGRSSVNRRLGADRAVAVADLLVERGVDRGLLVVRSLGEARRAPAAVRDRTRRRVEIRFLPPPELSPPVYLDLSPVALEDFADRLRPVLEIPRWDLDGDDHISGGELAQALFLLWDRDGDDRIDLRELADGAARWLDPPARFPAMAQADADGDTRLDFREFAAAAERSRVIESFGAPDGALPPPDFSRVLARAWDVDGDGILGEKELVRVAREVELR